MRRFLIAAAAVGLLALTGCRTQGNTAPMAFPSLQSFTTSANYDVLQRAEGSSEGGTILFFIPVGLEDKVGQGEAVEAGGGNPFLEFINFLTLGLFEFDPNGRVKRAALYNAIEAQPGADAILLPRYNTERTNYILYQHIKATVKGKAIRFNPTVND
jgi:hypothetical protein